MPERLSVIIPARNEQFLAKTITSVLDSARGDVEVIAVLDGYWPDPPILDAPSVILVHHTVPIGQRRAINEAVKISTGKYIMKLDGHCDLAPGFDVVLKEDCKYEWTMVPTMYNLDPIAWKIKRKFKTNYMYISAPDYVNNGKPYGLRAMYYGNWGGVASKRPESDKLVDETMACMGPGWFMWKDRFWELGGCDEAHGGWGQQGVEVSLKAWLSGGALMVNKRTWFAHWFRGGGQPEGLKSGFPYSLSQREIDRARAYSKDLWTNGKWPKQTRSLEWLVDKFNPPTWNGYFKAKEEPLQEIDLSVIIPSYKDPILHKTIAGILENFETNFEIIPVLDGYKPEQEIVKHDCVKPIYLDKNVGMREAINTGVRAARGKYLMRTDEHCMFCKGFDRIILADIKDNEIVDGRRYFLDPFKWELTDRTPIDYEKLIIKAMPLHGKKFASVEWISRSKERANIPIDEKMCWQGSVWVMAKSWWDKVIKALQTEGYGPLYQDTIEMLFKTWESGGKLMVNKNAWYAHRARHFGRVHSYPYSKAIPGWHYSLLKWYDHYLKAKERWMI